MKKFVLFILLFSLAFAQQIDILFYYQTGCSFCAQTELQFEELSEEYDLNIVTKEISTSKSVNDEFFSWYSKFNVSTNLAGTPTTLINGKTMIVGGATDLTWKKVFDACLEGTCTEGAFDGNLNSISSSTKEQSQPVTLVVLIGAALVDSINPCTIAVMVMLFAVILRTDGRGKMLVAASIFISIIFLMYLAMGFGLLHAVGTAQITDLFFNIVTVLAFILAVMEFNAYFNYKPGFFAVEMPLALRPLTKLVINKATTLPGITLAAIFCSLFLIPCSSGPYLTVLAMLSHSINAQTIVYLVLYNFVFILPMIAISLAIYYGKASVESIEQFKNEKVREIHLFSGIILFILFLIMLAKVLGYITI